MLPLRSNTNRMLAGSSVLSYVCAMQPELSCNARHNPAALGVPVAALPALLAAATVEATSGAGLWQRHCVNAPFASQLCVPLRRPSSQSSQ
jgi:hypothetical protein